MSIAKKIAFTAAVSFTLAATIATAQTPGRSKGSGHIPGHRVIHHGHNTHCGGFGYSGYRHGYRGYVLPGSGVDFGFAAHGAADLIRSRAEANLTNAQAATQGQAARTERLKNDVFALETRLERKRINSVSRFGHLHAQAATLAEQRLTGVQPVETKLRGAVPDHKRLMPEEIDPQTGKLAWPLILAMSHFEEARRPVDDVFAARAATGSLHPDDYLPLLKLIEQITTDVSMNAAIFPREDVAGAHDFLRRLKVEARMPATPPRPASQLASR